MKLAFNLMRIYLIGKQRKCHVCNIFYKHYAIEFLLYIEIFYIPKKKRNQKKPHIDSFFKDIRINRKIIKATISMFFKHDFMKKTNKSIFLYVFFNKPIPIFLYCGYLSEVLNLPSKVYFLTFLMY